MIKLFRGWKLVYNAARLPLYDTQHAFTNDKVFLTRSCDMKTLEANVVKSLFAVLSNLSLKVLQCHRR